MVGEPCRSILVVRFRCVVLNIVIRLVSVRVRNLLVWVKRSTKMTPVIPLSVSSCRQVVRQLPGRKLIWRTFELSPSYIATGPSSVVRLTVLSRYSERIMY